MDAADQLRAAAANLARALRDKATGTPARPVRVGIIETVNTRWDPITASRVRAVRITGVPGLNGNTLDVPASSWSSAFLTDVQAAEQVAAATGLNGTAAPGLTGRAVEIHFTDDQPVIAYLLGGPNG